MGLARVPILAIVALLMTVDGATASPVPTVSVNPAYGPPLTIVKVTGHAFCTTCGQVTIFVSSLAVDRASVAANGTFSKLIRIPGSSRPGAAMIGASQGGGRPALTTFTVTVDQPAPTTYPPPSSIPPPGNLPPPHDASTAHTRSRTSSPPVSGSPAESPTTSSTTAPQASVTPSGSASSASAAHGGRTPAWPWITAAAAAVLIGGSAWAFQRRRRRS